MPEIAHKSNKNVIVSKIYIEIIVKGNELLFGDFIVDHRKEGQQLSLNFLQVLLSHLVGLNFVGIEMLHWIEQSLLSFEVDSAPFLSWSIESKMC